MCVSLVVMNNNICLSPPLEVCGFLYKITNGTKLDPEPHVLQVWSCGPELTVLLPLESPGALYHTTTSLFML